jgi:hypothetical protein
MSEGHEGGKELFYTVAASPEEQKELELRRRAEEIADRAHEMSQVLGGGRRLKEGVPILDATDEDFEEVAEEPYDRQEAIQRVINMLRAREDYNNRSLAIIVRDTLSYIEAARASDEGHYDFRHSLGREAWYVLKKAGENGGAEEVDSKLLEKLKQWAALQVFSYHEYREWEDIGVDEYMELVEKAGFSKDVIEGLVNDPIDDEAARIAKERSYDAFDVLWGNSSRLEIQMLEQVKDLGLEVGEVHPYGNIQSALGI